MILETGELGSYDRVRQASVLAMAAGADFIKTSTGKIGVSATLPAALCMMEAARDFHGRRATGWASRSRAGCARPSRRSSTWWSCTRRSGEAWLTPELFRIGASSLLNDVLMQLEKGTTGRYAGPDHFTDDWSP